MNHHRPPHGREALAILGLFVAAIILLWLLAAMQANAAQPNRVESYTCNNSHYQKFEDGSGILYCGRAPMVRVHVTH